MLVFPLVAVGLQARVRSAREANPRRLETSAYPSYFQPLQALPTPAADCARFLTAASSRLRILALPASDSALRRSRRNWLTFFWAEENFSRAFTHWAVVDSETVPVTSTYACVPYSPCFLAVWSEQSRG